MSTTTTPERPHQNLIEKRRVIPIATLIPISAIVFAFSLGPSPEKRLEAFYRSPTDQQAARALSDLGPSAVPLVAKTLLRADLPRRNLSIAFLGTQGGAEAPSVLRAFIDKEQEPPELRAMALQSLQKLVAEEARAIATNYRDREDALGEVARAMIGGHASLLTKRPAEAEDAGNSAGQPN